MGLGSLAQNWEISLVFASGLDQLLLEKENRLNFAVCCNCIATVFGLENPDPGGQTPLVRALTTWEQVHFFVLLTWARLPASRDHSCVSKCTMNSVNHRKFWAF